MLYGPHQIADMSIFTVPQLFIECSLCARSTSFHLASTRRQVLVLPSFYKERRQGSER